MLLATMILLCAFSEKENVAKAIAERSPALASDAQAKSASSQILPSAPQPKVEPDGDLLRRADSSAEGAAANKAAPSAALKAVQPGAESPSETRRQRRIWYGLIAGGHGAAVFDAWSTRRAISRGYGTEGNPLLRPFAHSGAMYAATQVSPLLMDFLGKRMMTSRHPWMRRVWWLPQTAGMAVSVGAGVHNLEIVR
jgi:hypothetical protein